MAGRFDVGKNSFYLRISKVARTLVNEIMPSVIKWHHGAKTQGTSDAFGEITRFFNILWAVDGSHIPEKIPMRIIIGKSFLQ